MQVMEMRVASTETQLRELKSVVTKMIKTQSKEFTLVNAKFADHANLFLHVSHDIQALKEAQERESSRLSQELEHL